MKTMQLGIGVLLAATAGAASDAIASGFQLMEQNASGLGNAYAGAAAAAEDASTVFFNPAGMSLLKGRQAVVVGHLINPSARFSNNGSTAAAGGFGIGPNGGDAGDLVFVPNAYLSWPLDAKWTAGIGFNVPYGLTTDYDTNWVGRFHGLRSDLKTINVNPSIAYKVNDGFSLGFGLNWQRAEAELTKAVNYSFVAAAAGIGGVAAGSEGTNRISGTDSSWGYNLGVMFNLTPQTRMGLTYRSAIGYTLGGTVTYANRPAALQAALVAPAIAAQIGDGPVTADMKLPATFSAALKHSVNSRWDVLADATWTQWSSFQSLVVVRGGGTVLENTPENWRDTWRVGVGLNYHANDRWTYRIGVAYDQSPVPEAYRTPRIPDQDRRWVAFGAQYRVSRSGAVDVGYAHVFVKDPQLNMTGPPSLTAAQTLGRGALVGPYENRIDILSVQYRHTF
jgi:long-chain fatty acid transport protein